ncbi:MAG TPA: Ig-like domain-containing protein, partial [Mycobacterium sp.]
SADGDMLLLTDEFGGGLTGTDCQTELSGAGKIGAGHFWALAPIPGQPSTDAASESNPVRLGHWINPNPLAGEETIPRAERACTIHVFRMGGNGTSSPGPIQGGFDGVSTLGARELTVAMYGAGVWFMDFSSPPSNADGVVEDTTTTWGNTLGYIIMPGADTWSAKEYKGYVYAGDIARGFDIYGFADCANVAECIIDPVGNNPPNAEDDSASVNRGDSVLIDVLANDSDPDCIPITGPCDTITITSFTQPAHGTLIDNGNGTFTYDHDGSAAASDSFRYVIQDGRGGADSATVTIAVNAPPIALDDTARVAQGGSVNIDVKANDSDADDPNSALTVSLESGPTNGVAVVEADGSITYSHNGTATTGDSFRYRLTDPHGASDTATVSITVTGPSPEDGIKITGGGYLLTPDGDKINFGFNAKVQADGSLMGDLRLSDKNDSVKVHLKTLTALGGVTAPCGSVPNAATTVELRGSGTFGKQAATFRVCVQDNGEPDNSGPTANPDLFHLECVTGCVYTTTDRAADERIDGGNIQVYQPEDAGGGGTGGAAPAGAGTSGSSSSSTNASASTLILDPVLLTEGTVGSLQTLTVRAFDANQAPLAGANLTLRAVAADGSLLDSLVGLTDASGIASFSVGVVLGEVEYLVWSG